MKMKQSMKEFLNSIDDFGLNAERESLLASQYLGFAVRYECDVTADPDVGVLSDHVAHIPRPAQRAYPDDREHWVSVRAFSGGLPSLGKK